MRTFVSGNGLDGFPHLADESGNVWRKFAVTQQSTYVVMDATGRPTHTGVLRGGEGLADKVRELLG